MDTYFEVIYETFFHMFRKLIMSDNRIGSVLIICMCVSVLIGVCIFAYRLYADISSKCICNEFWLGIILLLPILGLAIFIIAEIFAKIRKQKIMKMCYRKVFLLPVALNVTLLCLSSFIPFNNVIDIFMHYLNTQEQMFAKGAICFLISSMIGWFILLYYMHKSCYMHHVFAYDSETEDGTIIESNEVLGTNVGKWLQEKASRDINDDKGNATLEPEEGYFIDFQYWFLKNRNMESYCLLKYEDNEDYTYAEYASNNHGDNRFIVTNVVPEIDDFILSYIISLMYGMIISFPIYYCIIMRML